MNRKYVATGGVSALNLRMPRETRLLLEESARKNGRSLNAEILQALHAWLKGYSQL
jgi:predicted HicB family RNase H-like nuclease